MAATLPFRDYSLLSAMLEAMDHFGPPPGAIAAIPQAGKTLCKSGR
jgi:hypothetical protein